MPLRNAVAPAKRKRMDDARDRLRVDRHSPQVRGQSDRHESDPTVHPLVPERPRFVPLLSGLADRLILAVTAGHRDRDVVDDEPVFLPRWGRRVDEVLPLFSHHLVQLFDFFDVEVHVRLSLVPAWRVSQPCTRKLEGGRATATAVAREVHESGG